MIKDLISKSENILKATNIVASSFSLILEEETTNNETVLMNLESIISKNKSNKITITSIKNAFGNLFYGALYPINGVSSKNRRFKDGNSESTGYNNKEQEGCCVWKYIGNKGRWQSGRPTWYRPDRVFDCLKQEHIDLVIDGLRNRKDQQQVAAELFQIREDILALLYKHFNYELTDSYNYRDSQNSATVIKLPKEMSCKAVITYKSPNMDIGADGGDKIMPADLVDVKIEKLEATTYEIRAYIRIPKAVYKYLDTTYSLQSYNFHTDKNGNHILPMTYEFDDLKKPLYKEINYSNNIYILGMDNVFNTKIVKEKLIGLDTKMTEVQELLEQAQQEYAGRLLMKGAF